MYISQTEPVYNHVGTKINLMANEAFYSPRYKTNLAESLHSSMHRRITSMIIKRVVLIVR